MSNIITDREAIFAGSDFSQPRMVVENQKMKKKFPDFSFYKTKNRISSVQGILNTNFGTRYKVKVIIPIHFPYELPDICLPEMSIDQECVHKFGDNKLCVMKREHWSSIYSLALLVSFAAKWLNKYDLWLRNGKDRWPGNDSHRE